MAKDIHLSSDIIHCVANFLVCRDEVSSLAVAARLHRGEYLVRSEMEALARSGKIVLKDGISNGVVYAIKVVR